MFALHLEEKHTLKSYHSSKTQAVFSLPSLYPYPRACQKAILSPISKISMFKTCSVLTGGKKKSTLNTKSFESSLTFEAFVFFNPSSANFVFLFLSAPSVEIFYSLQARLSA